MEKWYDEEDMEDFDGFGDEERFEDEEGFDEEMDSKCESDSEDDDNMEMKEQKVSRKKLMSELSQMIQFMHGNTMIQWLYEDHWEKLIKEEEEKEKMNKEIEGKYVFLYF
uniref:Uncharacterized protein n=1 Tax=Panagrolaimus davidi TaxID=227884 RepID=A0A914P161_9BILA